MQVLSDPEKKRKYDQTGEDPNNPNTQQQGHPGGGVDPMDIFSQFFGQRGGGQRGGGGRRQQQQRVEPFYEEEEDVSEVQSMKDFENILAGAQVKYQCKWELSY